jgi:hypothetical protein
MRVVARVAASKDIGLFSGSEEGGNLVPTECLPARRDNILALVD